MKKVEIPNSCTGQRCERGIATVVAGKVRIPFGAGIGITEAQNLSRNTFDGTHWSANLL